MSINIANNAPVPFFKRISLESSQAGELIATVDLMLKQDDDFNWRRDSVKNRLSMRLIRVTDSALFDKYTKPSARMELVHVTSKSKTIKGHSLSKAEVRTLDISSSNSLHYNKTTKTIDSSYTEVFRTEKTKPKFLGFIALVCRGMNSRLSEISAEIVIDRSQVKTEAKVLVSPVSGLGTVSFDAGNILVRADAPVDTAGVQLSPVEQAVPNTTIQDFRDVEAIKNLKIDETVVQKSIFDSRTRRTPAHNKKRLKNAYFSDMHLSFDPQGNCRYQFSINIAEMIKDHSQFPRLIASEDGRGNVLLDHERHNLQKILFLSRIKSLVIKRRKVHYLDKNNHSHLMSSLEPNVASRVRADNKEEIVARSSDSGNSLQSKSFAEVKSSKKEEKTIRPIGHIREVDSLFLTPTADSQGRPIPPTQFRHFTGVDLSMKENNHGEYDYSVEIEIKDGTMEYLRGILQRLKSGLVALEEYNNYLAAANKNPKLGFKAVSNSFVNVQDLNLSSIVGRGTAPWAQASANLMEVVKVFETMGFGGDGPSFNVHENLYLMSSPQNGSFKGVAKLIEATRIILSKLENMVRDFSRGSQNLGSDSSPKSSGMGSRSPLSTFKIKHDFEESVSPNKFIEAGYDYVGENRLSGDQGLKNISLKSFNARGKEETLKYFSQNQTESGKIMDGTIYEDSLTATEMSYLTPKNIHLSAKTHEMYTIKNNKVERAPENTTTKTLIDIISYKKFGHIPEIDVEPKEGIDVAMYDKEHPENPANKQIAIKLSDLLLLSDCSVEPYVSRIEDSTDLAENEIETREVLGASVSKRSDSEAKDPPRNTATTARNKETLQANANNISAPLALLTHTNILGENSRLKSFDVNSSNFMYSQPSKRRLLPNQHKSLIADSAQDPMVNSNWFSEENNLEKISSYILHHKTLATIEVLTGYNNGNLRKPIWTTLNRRTVDNMTNSSGRNLLCRIKPHTDSKNNGHGTGRPEMEILDLPTYNQHFLLDVTAAITQLAAASTPMTTTVNCIPGGLQNNLLINVDNEFIFTKSTSFGMVEMVPIVKPRTETPRRVRTTAATQNMGRGGTGRGGTGTSY